MSEICITIVSPLAIFKVRCSYILHFRAVSEGSIVHKNEFSVVFYRRKRWDVNNAAIAVQ